MELVSYFGFADNDYACLVEDFNKGRIAIYIIELSYYICERYLKEIVEECCIPKNNNDELKKQSILKSHSLNSILKYLKKYGIIFSNDSISAMLKIDGMYFSSRYPGDDSLTLDSDDMKLCKEAVTLCRKETCRVLNSFKIVIIDNALPM